MKKTDSSLATMREAHRRGDVPGVRALLEVHPELEKSGPQKNSTWLHLAAQEGHITLVDFWLDRGWNVNVNSPGVPEADGMFTALHMATDTAMTRHLLSRGASVNVCHRVLGTPLHYAIIRANTDQARVLLGAGADLTLMNGEEKGYTPLAWAMHLRRKSAEQLLRKAGAPEKGIRPFRRRPKTKILDLRRDFTEVYTYLADRVRAFKPSGDNVLGEASAVKMIDVGFEYSQAGWLVVVFDTRANAKPDGKWTLRIEGNELERPHWLEAGEAQMEGPITLIQLDGAKSKLRSGTELAEILGEVVKSVVLKARGDGVFAALPKATGCELGVEHFGGTYGWPIYKERGQDNLVEP